MLEACNFINKETLAQVFPVNFAKFLRTPFLQNTSGRLLLHHVHMKTIIPYSSSVGQPDIRYFPDSDWSSFGSLHTHVANLFVTHFKNSL